MEIKIPKKRKFTKRARKRQLEVFLSLVFLILTIILLVKFHTSPTIYQLVNYQEDQQMETIKYYTSFKMAKREMQQMIDQGAFNPAILDDDGNIVAIRYGVVNFNTKTCGENTSYTLENKQQTGYTNGCYGADGAYLETDDRAEKVRFKQSGAVGWVNLSDIEILNYYDSEKLVSLNYYTLDEGKILHVGTSDLYSNEGVFSIDIGENTAGLSGDTFYSYDGNYFYASYPEMIDDYRRGNYEHSSNAENAYYNYYQYLSHRSKSTYVSKDLNYYITDYLGYQAKPSVYPAGNVESQLYDEGYSFIKAQNTYGTNAIMMFALAINESGFGKSQIAIEKNNLFGHAAYDASPNESADGYADVASSITTHASIFLNQGYLNPCDQADPANDSKAETCFTIPGNRYMGGYFGNKGSGMNVNYASDPYWGEKAAQYYRTFDEIMGEQDKGRYTIKVLDRKKTPAYALPDTASKVIFYTPEAEHYACIILDEIEGKEVEGNTKWYKIQSDAVLNEARNALVVKPDNYNNKNDIVYIPAAYFEQTEVE